MELVWKGSPNYNRRTMPVKRIVIHWFGLGTLESANTRFQNPATQVSAHYGISKGRIWQWVKESDVAWHSGNAAVNAESIGIEHDATLNGHNLSDEDYRLSAEIVAEICKRHNIPLDRKHIIGHREVKATQCPGTIDIDRIINLAKPIAIPLPLTLVANKNNWNTLADQLAGVSEWFTKYSQGRLNVTFDVIKTGFQEVPLAPFLGMKSVDINWYREHVTPLVKGKGSLFLLNPDQYQNGNTFGFMTYGDPGRPVRMELTAVEDEPNGGTTIFAQRAFHEVCHMLFFLTGQPDKTHEYLYQESDKKADLLALVDYVKLEKSLSLIKSIRMSQAKVVKSKVDGSIYVCYEMPDFDYLKKKANLEGFEIPTIIPDTDSLR